MIMYLNQANVALQHKKSNEILAYFLHDKIQMCIRFENPLESYIIFEHQSSITDIKQGVLEDWESGDYDLLLGEIEGE